MSSFLQPPSEYTLILEAAPQVWLLLPLHGMLQSVDGTDMFAGGCSGPQKHWLPNSTPAKGEESEEQYVRHISTVIAEDVRFAPDSTRWALESWKHPSGLDTQVEVVHGCTKDCFAVAAVAQRSARRASILSRDRWNCGRLGGANSGCPHTLPKRR